MPTSRREACRRSKFIASKTCSDQHTSRVTDLPAAAPDVLWVMQDVTAEYKTDQLKNQYLSIVAHELRTPLTGHQDVLDDDGEGSSTRASSTSSQQRVSSRSASRSLRLEHQIDKLINLGHLDVRGRLRPGSRVASSVSGALVDRPLAPFESGRDREPDIETFSVHCDEPVAIVRSRPDRADLRSGRCRLIVENAIKFTPERRRGRSRCQSDTDEGVSSRSRSGTCGPGDRPALSAPDLREVLPGRGPVDPTPRGRWARSVLRAAGSSRPTAAELR